MAVAIRKMGSSQRVLVCKPILAPVGLQGMADLPLHSSACIEIHRGLRTSHLVSALRAMSAMRGECAERKARRARARHGMRLDVTARLAVPSATPTDNVEAQCPAGPCVLSEPTP